MLPMGLKNAPVIFQRMMDWECHDFPNVDTYIDDIIIGSKGNSMEELVEKHTKDLKGVLN